MKSVVQVRERNAERDPFPYVLALISIAWLPFGLGTAVVKALQSHYTSLHLGATIVGAAVFMGIYLWGTWTNTRAFLQKTLPTKRLQLFLYLKIAVLIILSLALMAGNGYDWMGLFIFTCAYSSSSLSGRPAVWVAVGLTLGATVFSRLIDPNWFDAWSAFFLVGVVGVMVISMVRFYRVRLALQIAQDEIARLAVVMERLRIARDLHDLLGHSLSLIALKSELAGRLVNAAPERAISEIADVEQVARTTLQEVREAVGNYRQPTLANELEGASEILVAAGISYQYKGEESAIRDLPGAIEALLAWGVREGVTNVIRHSRAQTCIIRLTREKQMLVCLEVINDHADSAAVLDVDPVAGQIMTEELVSSKSNGLRGLRERVEALHGRLEAGHYDKDGFRLALSVPLV